MSSPNKKDKIPEIELTEEQEMVMYFRHKFLERVFENSEISTDDIDSITDGDDRKKKFIECITTPSTEEDSVVSFKDLEEVFDGKGEYTNKLSELLVRNVNKDEVIKLFDATLHATNEWKKREIDKVTDGLTEQQKVHFGITYYDNLTGAYNRSGFRFLENWVNERKEEVSISVIDGDYFKILNDLGEEYVDLFITIIAKHLGDISDELNKIGEKTFFYRFGGEEFIFCSEGRNDQVAILINRAMIETKRDIRKCIPGVCLEELAKRINKAKFNNERSINDIIEEIGCYTAGVLAFNFKNVEEYVEKSNQHIVDSEVAQIALDVVDGLNIRQKTKKRSVVATEARDDWSLVKKLSNVENKQRNKSFLDDIQLKNIEDFHELMTERSILYISKIIEVLGELGQLSSDAANKIVSVIKPPTFDIQELKDTAEKYGIKLDTLLQIKSEHILFDKYLNMLSGAYTPFFMRRMRSYQESDFYNQPIFEMDIGAFKSFNETLGHINADSYIQYVYEDVMKYVLGSFGLKNGKDIIVSQDKVKFNICFGDSIDEAKREDIQDAIRQKYTEKINEFYNIMDIGIDKKDRSYKDIRKDWINEHDSDNISAQDGIKIQIKKNN